MDTVVSTELEPTASTCRQIPRRISLRPWHWRAVLLLVLVMPAWLLDESVLAWSQRTQILQGLGVLRSIPRRVGEPLGVAAVVLTAWVIDRRSRRLILLAVLGVSVTAGTIACVKQLVGRERPKAVDGKTVFRGPVWPASGTPSPSLPSAHTAVAFALASGLSRLYPRGTPIFLLVASACGASRMLSGKHFLTDVLIGAWLGWELAALVWHCGFFRRLCRVSPFPAP